MNKTALIATLGGQPQVITFALDALFAKGESIDEVYVLHLSTQSLRLRQALAKLSHEFVNDRYAGRRCRFRPIPIRIGAEPLADIRTEREATATLQAIRSLISELKEQDRWLHICVSGGRRMMALLCMSEAALLCDDQDHLWHMYTPDTLQESANEGAVMHASPVDGVQLIRVPQAPWGAYFPALRTSHAPSGLEAVAHQMGWLNKENQAKCQQVYDRATSRQRDTLRAYARGLNTQEVAEELCVAMSTVNTHKSALLAECRIAWELAEDEPLDFHFLSKRFMLFMQELG